MTTRVIVVNWNGRDWLARCLQALAHQTLPPAEVVVVDNASTDGSVAWVRTHHPDVTVRALATNVGFAAGNNRGAEGAQTDALVFLNNDTEADSTWLERLVQAASADPSRAMVTSQLVYWDRPDIVDSAGDGYLQCGGAFKAHHGGLAATAPGSRAVFGACGAAFLIRRDWFARLGGFDESLFMVYEDVDLSYRARLQGAVVWYEAGARVRHGGSASLGRVSAAAVEYGQRNMERVWLINSPRSVLWWSLPSHVAYNVLGAAAYARQGRAGAWWRGKWAVAREWRAVRARRAVVQATRTVPPAALWSQMERRWIRVKRAEKTFDFRP